MQRPELLKNAFGLTPKQSAFVLAYAADANATQAAIAAGSPERSATVTGSRLLATVNVREAIQREMDATKVATTITKALLVQTTWEIVRDAKATGAKAVALRGVELLAKMHGYIVEKRDVRVITSWEDLSDEELRVLAGPEPPADDSAKGQS